jgi:hypothetical protein
MRKWKVIIVAWAVLDLLAGYGGLLPGAESRAAAQATPANPISTQQITMPVFTLNPAPASGASVQLSGNPGPKTIFYWVVANYLVGNATLAGPFAITNAPNTLSGSNFVKVAPLLPSGATGYDLLKTVTTIPPGGACACAVATGVAVGTVTNDQANSTGAYTVNTLDLNTLNLTLTNEVQSAGVAHLMLRSAKPGVASVDLSAPVVTVAQLRASAASWPPPGSIRWGIWMAPDQTAITGNNQSIAQVLAAGKSLDYPDFNIVTYGTAPGSIQKFGQGEITLITGNASSSAIAITAITEGGFLHSKRNPGVVAQFSDSIFTSDRYIFGMIRLGTGGAYAPLATDTPTVAGAAFFNRTTDTTWQAWVGNTPNGGSNTFVSTGVSSRDALSHQFDVNFDGVNTSFYIDKVLVAQIPSSDTGSPWNSFQSGNQALVPVLFADSAAQGFQTNYDFAFVGWYDQKIFFVF